MADPTFQEIVDKLQGLALKQVTPLDIDAIADPRLVTLNDIVRRTTEQVNSIVQALQALSIPAASTGGTGTQVEVNESDPIIPTADFNDSTPTPPVGKSNVRWQKDRLGRVSAYYTPGSPATPAVLKVNGVAVPEDWNLIDGFGNIVRAVGSDIHWDVNFDPTNGALGTVLGAAIANTVGNNAGNFDRLFGNGSLAGGIKGGIFPVSGWVKKLCCCFDTMPQGAAFQLGLYQNTSTASQPLSLTVPPGQALGFKANNNTYVHVNAGDLLLFSNFNPGITTGDIGGFTLSFVADEAGELGSQVLGWDCNQGSGLTVAGAGTPTTRYLGMCSTIADNNRSSNEYDVEFPIPFDGTITRLILYTVGAQPATGSLVVTLRKGAGSTGVMGDTLQTVTITAGAGGGVYADFSDPITVHAEDRITVSLVNNATSASTAIVNVALSFIPLVQGNALIGGVWSGGNIAGGTTYMAPMGGGKRAVGQIHQAELPMSRPGVLKSLHIYNPVVTSGGGHQKYTLFKNGITTLVQVDLSATTAAGVYKDLVNSFSVVQGDRISLEWQNTDGGSANNAAGWAALLEAA